MKNYTELDLVSFNRFANENKNLKPFELIKYTMRNILKKQQKKS